MVEERGNLSGLQKTCLAAGGIGGLVISAEVVTSSGLLNCVEKDPLFGLMLIYPICMTTVAGAGISFMVGEIVRSFYDRDTYHY